MTQELRDAIKILAQKITSTSQPESDMKYTQAALNAAHTLATLVSVAQSEV